MVFRTPSSLLTECLMARATVLEFSQQGFGKLQLDSGEIYTFDVLVCDTMEIDAGDTADVVLKELAGRVRVREVRFDKLK